MNSQLVLGKSIVFDFPTQIINIGGPWVGTLVIDQKVIADSVLVDNLYPNPKTEKLYFIRYHDVSKWQKNNFFFVYFIEIESGEMYMYDLKFEQIFIDNISSDNEMTYFEAFHNKNEEQIREINLNTVKCIHVKNVW